ncbi:hypothetical protein [Athalassotoga saccharophila]|uniref:hypothetical protein n=1 Tax=Athalassotoga saccharophila TaxID=1441386 RepID=UPI0013794C87|nr:hypothetical protein [Athalassotoga saccharophila]BBJ27626.1 hypothetical protein ATHSA_0503 [Athalassotoga saccharophila]
MKRYIFLLVLVVLVSLILSSCAINVFKGLNTPANTQNLSQIAINEANSGNFKEAISASVQVLNAVSNGTIPSTNIYSAVVLSDTSTSARNTLATVTNFLNTTQSTSVALKNAAEAMLSSINGTMRLNAITLASSFISIWQSQNLSVLSNTSSISTAYITSAINLIVSSSHNIQLMQLLEALSSTLNRFDPSNPNWLISKGIYAALQIPIILFDSNGNNVLDSQDQIFKYLPADYNGILYKVQLQTYNNIQKSNELLADLSTALTSLDSGLNEMSQSNPQMAQTLTMIRSYIVQIETALYVVNAEMISQIQYLGDIQKISL